MHKTKSTPNNYTTASLHIIIRRNYYLYEHKRNVITQSTYSKIYICYFFDDCFIPCAMNSSANVTVSFVLFGAPPLYLSSPWSIHRRWVDSLVILRWTYSKIYAYYTNKLWTRWYIHPSIHPLYIMVFCLPFASTSETYSFIFSCN